MPRARLHLAELLVFGFFNLRVFIVSKNDLMNVIDQEVNNTDTFFGGGLHLTTKRTLREKQRE